MGQAFLFTACYNACVLAKSNAERRFNVDWSNAYV